MIRNWMHEHRPEERDEGVESSNSWYETQDENTDDEERMRRIQGSCHNNVHLTGLMTNPETGKSTKLKMVVDQGQTVKQGIMISEELMKELGLSFEKLLPGKKVGTAKGGATLEKVGITKPFSLKELNARVQAVLRRSGGARSMYRFGTVEVDLDNYVIRHPDAEERLSNREQELLRYLIEHRGQVLPRSDLLTGIWRYSPNVTTRTVDTHILNVRKKLRDDAANPRFIEPLHGVGYRFIASEG